MYRQERAGRTEKDTARTESYSEIQRRTGQPNDDELRKQNRTRRKKEDGTRTKRKGTDHDGRSTQSDRRNNQKWRFCLAATAFPLRDGCCRCYLLHTRRMHTFVLWGRGEGVGGVVGSETNFGAGFECCGERIPFPRENRCIVTRTGLGGSFKFAWSFGGERGFVSVGDEGRERSVLLSAADGGVCGVGEKSGRKCWSVYNESGGSVQSPTRFLRSSRTSANQHATRRPANPVTLRTRLVRVWAAGHAVREWCPADPCRRRAFHQFQNRRMPQQLCGHILNINLRHVQSEWSVGSASAGQRRATRERSGLVFANFSGIRCLLASPDCRIDPAGSVPLVGSLVCGRFVDELDFGFTTHGASEQGNFTFGAVRTLGAD
ncbi:hypothetical protein BLNAU_16540 [Blattamonas nauphoetae]|uniref:Uncharacterized protein n=1 Tax=Blattamonas nauphoetae TaxID=2049346 RepID=A0ABQ9XAZ1_9EUKA|nr:hypothetical protein BLNAU_16540 [Blattamonas nauphoetae]